VLSALGIILNSEGMSPSCGILRYAGFEEFQHAMSRIMFVRLMRNDNVLSYMFI